MKRALATLFGCILSLTSTVSRADLVYSTSFSGSWSWTSTSWAEVPGASITFTTGSNGDCFVDIDGSFWVNALGSATPAVAKFGLYDSSTSTYYPLGFAGPLTYKTIEVTATGSHIAFGWSQVITLTGSTSHTLDLVVAGSSGMTIEADSNDDWHFQVIGT